MVKYCETAKCRHAVFSKFFGDSPPKCENRCDVCKDCKSVEKALSQFESNKVFKKGFITGPLKIADSGSLYGEGRVGQKRMAEDYGEDTEGDSEGREKRAKQQLKSAIDKQFKLRKGGDKEELEERKKEEAKAAMYAKVTRHVLLLLTNFFT